MFSLDSIIDATENTLRNGTHGGDNSQIVSENHDVNSINWVNGMSDPGEMIRCGYLPQIRRRAGERDAEYQARIQVIIDNLPAGERDKIMRAGREAAVRRAGLDTSNGRINVMVAGEAPWHALGVNVRDAVNSAKAIELAGLGWSAVKVPAGWTFEGRQMSSTETFVVIRSDTGAELGSVGSRYQPIQNAAGFTFLDDVLAEHGALYETAGSVHGGRRVWMQVRLPRQAFEVVPGDEVHAFALFVNSHDGTSAAACYPTSQRVVCNNTLRLSGSDRHKGISVRHTGDVKSKVRDAQAALGIAVRQFDEFKDTSEALVAHRVADRMGYFNGVLDAILEVSEAQRLAGSAAYAADVLGAAVANTEARDRVVREYEAALARRKGILDDIVGRHESERCGIGGTRGTAWGAFNAVTEHADHFRGSRQSKDAAVRESRRFDSILTGDADEMKQVAFRQALALTR